MKNIIIIITILLFSYSLKAQEQEKSYDDIIYLGLPSYLYKPSNTELTNFLNNRKEIIMPLPFQNIIFYISGETFLRLSAFEGFIKSDILEEQKEFFDYMNAQGTGTTSYSSEIKSINNANLLLVHEERPTSYCSYYIIASNTNNNKLAKIVIKYKLTDKVAAEKIANIILANLRFVEKPVRQ